MSHLSWLCQGRRGWWRYDARTEEALDELYEVDRLGTTSILIAGHMYEIDFNSWFQVRPAQWATKFCFLQLFPPIEYGLRFSSSAKN